MMKIDMKTILTLLFAIGAAIVCLVMVLFGIISHDIPALLWLAFSGLTFANVVLNLGKHASEYNNTTAWL